jgi:hypothetical protein
VNLHFVFHSERGSCSIQDKKGTVVFSLNSGKKEVRLCFDSQIMGDAGGRTISLVQDSTKNKMRLITRLALVSKPINKSSHYVLILCLQRLSESLSPAFLLCVFIFLRSKEGRPGVPLCLHFKINPPGAGSCGKNAFTAG